MELANGTLTDIINAHEGPLEERFIWRLFLEVGAMTSKSSVPQFEDQTTPESRVTPWKPWSLSRLKIDCIRYLYSAGPQRGALHAYEKGASSRYKEHEHIHGWAWACQDWRLRSGKGDVETTEFQTLTIGKVLQIKVPTLQFVYQIAHSSYGAIICFEVSHSSVLYVLYSFVTLVW